MIDDPLDGPRLAELLLAEVVGRDIGPLETIAVDGLDHPAAFTCAVADQYTVTRDETPVATVAVHPAHIELSLAGDGTVRIEHGRAIKPGLDELLRRLAAQ